MAKRPVGMLGSGGKEKMPAGFGKAFHEKTPKEQRRLGAEGKAPSAAKQKRQAAAGERNLRRKGM